MNAFMAVIIGASVIISAISAVGIAIVLYEIWRDL